MASHPPDGTRSEYPLGEEVEGGGGGGFGILDIFLRHFNSLKLILFHSYTLT